MLRRLALFALLVGCPGPSKPVAPSPPDDSAVRIRIAYAEARRGGGVAELVDLAAHGTKVESLLALRGLGRIGGATALESLRVALSDGDIDIITAAAAGIGLAASLDDEDLKVTAALILALPRSRDHVAVIEALGRAGDASAQPALISKMPSEAAAIALGRHGRRKIALSDEARDALAKATSHTDVKVRYAATWALARETITDFEAPKVVSVVGALSARITDDDPEVRAQAIAALARRKQVKVAAPAIEQALLDKDWRVAVEAVRALGADDYRGALVAALVRGVNVHAAREIIKNGIGKPVSPGIKFEIDAPAEEMKIWTLLAGVQVEPIDALLASKQPRRHLALGLLADWVKAKGGTIDDRRRVLRALLADSDVRVQAAGLGVLASMWKDGDDKDHELAMKTVIAAIASKDPIVSGSAIEAAEELYVLGDKESLSTAIVSRASGEKDVELASSLYTFIGKHAIGSGAAACKQGLEGHVVLVKAAADCLKKLGESPPAMLNPPVGKLPLVDITAVIGKRVTWRVTTTRGEITVELRPDVAPWAVATIVSLTKRGYYDGLEFHRVVGNFVVQGGDPTESGWGGPGFMIPAEPGSVLDGHGFVAGGVGIADAGRDSGGSQWFVMHSRATHLDGRYTWIGSVVNGNKFADSLLIGDEILKAIVEISDR